MQVGQSSEQSDGLDPVVEAVAVGSFDAFYLVEFPKMVVWATALTGDPGGVEAWSTHPLLAV